MKIISSAPTRISFLGGGTDIDSFCKIYGGIVVNTAINLREHIILLTGNDMFEYTKHSFPVSAKPELCYKILENYNLNGLHNCRVISSFDGFMGAGLGSSSAFTVALIAACEKLSGNVLEPSVMAEKAYGIEMIQLGRNGGRQDHYAASYGGCNIFSFMKKNTVMPFHKEVLKNLFPYLLLFYVGGMRDSSNLQKQLIDLNKKQEKSLLKLAELTIHGITLLNRGNIKRFAELISYGWNIKKEINPKASNKRIDDIYDFAMQFGALGGKLLGAGGGGYMLFLVDPQKQKEFLEKMKEKNISHIDFQLDYQGVETRIL